MGQTRLYAEFETCFGLSTQGAGTKTHLESRFCAILISYNCVLPGHVERVVLERVRRFAIRSVALGDACVAVLGEGGQRAAHGTGRREPRRDIPYTAVAHGSAYGGAG